MALPAFVLHYDNVPVRLDEYKRLLGYCNVSRRSALQSFFVDCACKRSFYAAAVSILVLAAIHQENRISKSIFIYKYTDYIRRILYNKVTVARFTVSYRVCERAYERKYGYLVFSSIFVRNKESKIGSKDLRVLINFYCKNNVVID